MSLNLQMRARIPGCNQSKASMGISTPWSMGGIRRLITGVLAAAIGSMPAATVYVPPSCDWFIASWRYAKGVEEPPANWRELDFDDARWNVGKAPFGYGIRGFARRGTMLADMKTGYTTVFLRRRFFVDDPAQTSALRLSVNYGDGFVAWLNGVKVAEQNAPAALGARAVATAAHPASPVNHYEVFAVCAVSLRRGDNVLAVQLLSQGLDRESAHFDASLINTRNLAFNRRATASSVTRNTRYFQPRSAVDGTQLTFWSSEPAARNSPEWFAVDLGAEHPIDKVRLHWWGGELPGVGGGARDYEVQVSPDGERWQTAATLTGQNGGEDEITFPTVFGRHLRIAATALNHTKNIGLLDVEVYREGVPFDAREFTSLAFQKPARASSQGWKGVPPAKAVDNNGASWWESHKDAPDPQWLEVDLQTPQRIAGLRVFFTERYAQRFVVQLADDETENWREPACRVDTENVHAGDNHRLHRIMFSSVQQARRVRILLWDKNSSADVDRYAITELMVIAETPH